jgi:Essential protein Yae1, N terminal
VQSGYREGIDVGKAQTVQEGFNEGRHILVELTNCSLHWLVRAV